jgi:1,4-dihydroxy-6-naphthoate synthase
VTLEITLGFSPCPNDTFIFDALIHQKIDTKGFVFKYSLADVETLNEWAFQDKLDVTKMSFAASCYLQQRYDLLQSGAALGNGVGPLLIANGPVEYLQNPKVMVALPGEKTTAHFLLNFAYPFMKQKIFMPFHEIEDWVLTKTKKEIRLGVIIHENRFTYQEKGLDCIADLGAYWETQTGLPIPLGGIFIKNKFDPKTKQAIDSLMKQSVEYAFKNYIDILPPFVTDHAQEMSESVMWQHIKLYVNNDTVQLSSKGLAAIAQMSSLLKSNH